MERVFKAFDTNKNGVMERNEFLELLHALGHRELKQEDADALMDGVDIKDRNSMTFTEFLNVMKKITNKEGKLQINTFKNKAGKTMVRLSKVDNNMQFQTFSEEERTAYVKVINSALADDPVCKKYLPIDPDSNEIFDRIKDGVLLCKLINKAQEGTIDERVINKKDNMNIFQQVENLNLAISAAKSIGLNCIGLNYDSIMDGKNYIMVLGLMWQVVKLVVMRNIQLKHHPELIRLLNPGEQLSDLLKLSPEQLLLRWFNYHLKQAGYDKKITNFSGDVKDSEKYTILLNQLNKNLCDKSALNDSDLKKRAKKVIDNSKKLGAESYITPDDIVAGNSKLNTLFVASIFNAYPGLEPPTEQEAMEAAKLLDDDVEGAREERAFRMWINSLGLNDENGEPIHINNLYEESRDGLLLLRTLDRIKPGCVNWKIVDKKPNNPFKKTANCNEVIDASKKSNYKIVGIGGGDIRDGNKKYILAIVWQMMRAHSLQVIGNKTEEELVAWGNDRVDSQYKVKSLKDKKLCNSLYFIHIMKSIEPRSINWDIVMEGRDDDEAKENNAKYAISIARKLGATVFLVWEDIAEVKSKLLLTLLASIYEVGNNYKANC
jgi:Ca2+-binding EF-hand superfamily protein